MALHTELDIFKASYDLVDLTLDLVKNMPRAVKSAVGDKLRDECLAITTRIQRANIAGDKAPHLVELQEHLEVANILLRLSRDKRFIATSQYARAVEITTSIGRQCTAWRKSPLFTAAPDASQPRLL